MHDHINSNPIKVVAGNVYLGQYTKGPKWIKIPTFAVIKHGPSADLTCTALYGDCH